MQNNNPAPPDSSQYLSPGDNAGGRARSDSVRSQKSQRSQRSQRSTENADFTRRPSIRIRRGPSYQPTPNAGQNSGNGNNITEGQHIGRNRANSAPQELDHDQIQEAPNNPRLSSVIEESNSPTSGIPGRQRYPILSAPRESDERQQIPAFVRTRTTPRRRSLRRARPNLANQREEPSQEDEEYDQNLVDLLDLVDPEVATLSTLTNVQNSLFVPDLGRYLNRRPTYTLTRRTTDLEESGSSSSDDSPAASRAPARMTAQRTTTGATLSTLSSNVNDNFYAVLPHGVALPNWSEEDKLELNDHVRHMLHSKRSRFKRSMKGFGQYVKKPLGLFVTVYATLITLFGLAWVLFLIGWINVGGRQSYLVNVIDNVLVALFAVVGDGLAPFRAVDTYHMIFIAHYHHLTWRLRKEQALPKLHNRNDLPAVQEGDLDAAGLAEEEKHEFSVLSPEQQKKLAHHTKKFSNSHSFYKPHETTTHHAFPLRLLIAIVVLLDCHSLLQIALGTCTWSISYHVRPFALTTVILCCSITCNITAGVLISVGDHKTRKKDVLEKMKRQELTAHAMKKIEKRRHRKHEKNAELDETVNPDTAKTKGASEEIERFPALEEEDIADKGKEREPVVDTNTRGLLSSAFSSDALHFGLRT